MIDEVLKAADISKRYGATQALDCVALNIFGNEIHALLGENGSGKSTLMKILSGQVIPDSGQISLLGKNVAFKSSRQALKNGIAIINQELNLCLDMNVHENLWLGNEKVKSGFVINEFEKSTADR